MAPFFLDKLNYNLLMKKLIFLILFPLFLFAKGSVLIVNSYHKGYEFSDSIVNGIEELLYPYSNIDINILYMDSKRLTSKEYQENLKKLYLVQLRDRKYDLVIAVDRFAYDLVLDIYSSVFSNEKILAVGIENFSKQRLKKYALEKKVSALIEKRDLKGNLKAIKKLIPGLKKLYIINDKSENALHTEPLIMDMMDNFDGDYELIYLKEDNLKNLEKRFSKKQEHVAALFIRFYKNRNNELNKIQDIARFINNSKVPMFVTDSIFVKKGATGGKIVDLKEFGKEAGQMALNILFDEKQKVKTFENLFYVFDAKKLEEFILPVDVLSNDYKIVNKRETFYDKNRGFINFVFTSSPLLLILIIGLIKNIVLRKKIEKDLKQRIEFDAVLLNAIDSPIFWENENGKIVDSNSKFCSLLKLTKDELCGKSLEEFSHNKNVKKVRDVLTKYKQNRKENFEFKYFDHKGKKVFLLKQETFRDKKSNTKGFVTIFTDVTKEREVEKEKQKNKQFIIQQSKLAEIGEVFSSIAHQWKAPLVEITAIAQELFYTKSCKEIKEDDSFVSDIMKQVNYMTNTINDFQQFIVPSNEKIKFCVKEAIESMLEIVNHNIKYNNIKINLREEEGTNSFVLGYKNEFMQSILNIVNNAKDALKNNDYKNRKIDINLFEENKKLVITIKDNAGGIHSKNIYQIFKPYYSTKKKGHGIGLYMSKMIIEDKMNGILFAENREDGALFTIILGQIS